MKIFEEKKNAKKLKDETRKSVRNFYLCLSCDENFLGLIPCEYDF